MDQITTQIIPKEQKTCFHCGEDCKDEIIHLDDYSFCCTGCKLVYEVLQENDLCTYYDVADAPGLSQKSVSQRNNRFDYLDHEEVSSRLIDFKNDQETHVTFNIPMIHCASCIWLLENLHKLNDGIISGRVDFLKKKVQVRFNHHIISLKELVQILSKIGYEPALNLSDIDKKSSAKVDKKLVFKLAVAGFCFGNMMFFSLPEYFSEAELLGDGFKNLFNYLNVLLALPVFFYAATDYYTSAFYSLKNKAVNMDVPIAIGIFTLFFYSLYEIFVLDLEGYMDTLGGLLFFLLLGKLYQQKTYDTLSFDRDYKSYFPIAVTKWVQDVERVIPLTQLNVGDLIKIRNEELIPSDSILIEGEAYIDYSFVTGEQVPVGVKKGQLIYAGGKQKGQPIICAVQKSPSQGYLTDLWNNEVFDKKPEKSLNALAVKISAKFTFLVLLIAFGALTYWSFSDVALGIKAFTAVLIITCPCALAMSTPFTLGNTLRVFGRGKFYLKNADVIEKLAEVDTVVFDKTGTLTDPLQAKVIYFSMKSQASQIDAFDKIEDLEIQEEMKVIKALVAQSTHPLSNRINAWIGNIEPAQLSFIEEISGKGLKAEAHGQLFLLGSLEFVGGTNISFEGQGNLVVFSINRQVVGHFLIQSGLRKDIDHVVKSIGEKMDVHFLSGDHDHERESLKNVFGENISMVFEQGPKDKLEYIQSLKDKGANVLMVGDGLNDAGALQSSNSGIAVIDKVSNFSPSSDAIIAAESLHQLPVYLDFAKTSRKIIKASFGLSFMYNIVGVYFAVQGLVSPVFCAILMPISSLSVVLFTTVTTNYLAYQKGLKNLQL
jgi:P-type Cu+ transporter